MVEPEIQESHQQRVWVYLSIILILPIHINSVHSLSSQIKHPLRQHPRQTGRRHNQRCNEPALEHCASKTQPLAHKVHQGDTIGPRSQIINRRRRNIVGCVSANDRREEGPGAKGAGGQRVGERLAVGGSGVVKLGSVGIRDIGLEAVCC